MNAFYDPPEKVEWWLQHRRTCIGASDAACVAGLSPWSTALGVWTDKVMPPAGPRPMTDDQARGLIMEPAILRMYEHREGVKLSEPDDPILFHPKHRFVGASLDRIRSDRRPVDAKNVHFSQRSKWGEDGSAVVPDHYGIQMQQQMAVTGVDVGDLAVLFGGSEFCVFSVPRQEDAITHLIQIETAFWAYVERKEAPPADWSHPSTPDLIIGLNRPTEGKECQLPDAAIALARDYEEFGAEAAANEKCRKQVKAKIIELMGAASVGHLPDGRRIVRNEIQRKAYEVAATSYFDFRIRAAGR